LRPLNLINFILLCFVFLFSSCMGWKDIDISKIEQVRLVKMDNDGIDAAIDVKINNPNNFGFTVYKSDLQVKLNNNVIGKARLTKNIRIKANSEQTYTFTVKGKLDNLLSGSGGLFGLIAIAASKSATIGLNGNIKAGRFFYKKDIPIDRKQNVPLIK
jgi:LEA14-like dessication related protein